METVKKRFVVADSDKEFVEEIKNILEKNGYTFAGSAADGIDAISECNIKRPDIIFVKKNLDFIDGFKISFNLREKGYSGLIILIGEKYSSEASKRALSCGADGFITKPVTEKFLVPWLLAKSARSEEKRNLFTEKTELLSKLEHKRTESEALGIIASSMGISFAEAKKLLEKKAEDKNMSFEEIAKLVIGKEE